MEEFKIYSISDNYIDYLRKEEPNVYSNKQDNRTHTNKDEKTFCMYFY